MYNAEEPQHKHMLAVCDSSMQNLVIVKTIIRDVDDLDERNYHLYRMLEKDSHWQIVRLCSLENFNKSFIGVFGIDQCPLSEAILDLQTEREKEYFPEHNKLRAVSDKLAGFKLNDSQYACMQSCLL